MNEKAIIPDATPNTAGELIGAGETVRQIQTSYVTAVAVQKARELTQVEERCLTEASLLGEGCYYGWGFGDDHVEGPSIECAMIALRNWGNAALEMREIHETRQSYIMTAAFIDLETGMTYSRQFRQSKDWTVYGKMKEARKADIRFQLGQSKCQRNVILRALPKWLIDKMVDKAKQGVREKIEAYVNKKSIADARKVALTALEKQGAKKEFIEAKLGKKFNAWDIETLVLLQGDIRAMQDGVVTADELYPDPEKVKESEEGLSVDEMKAGDKEGHQPVTGSLDLNDKK